MLTENAEENTPAKAGTDHWLGATVRRTVPDGSTRTDEARVPPKTPAGSRVKVWMDKRGGLTAEPLTGGEVRIHASLGGVLAATGEGGAVLGAAWVARLCLDRWRTEQWNVEWDRIDIRWGRKTGRPDGPSGCLLHELLEPEQQGAPKAIAR
ncbi:hypothetical protein GCM10010306_051320 [Streptomyces umbrinus]|uniref:Rv1733c family protein n=1 Tax=Streptomyces umbrinus TaxID=67370 RepID=UPI00167B1D9E|nr:hypothetical protein [Streptomyces umbrinus]GHB51344.1 hypothetical protein GCM10010306_051320 [Streptomyces umbrinus]